MDGPDIWWGYWYLHLPNYVLAALLYTMIGRFVLGFMVPANSPNYIWRWFCRLTDPVLRLLSFITPSYVAPRYMPLVGAFWLGTARVAWYLLLATFGMVPRLGGAG